MWVKYQEKTRNELFAFHVSFHQKELEEANHELQFSLTRMESRKLHTPAAATCFHFIVVFPHFIA